MHSIKFLQSIVFTISVICFAGGCGPSESDIITPEVIKKIEARFSTDGVKAKFIKVHSLTGADGDFYLEAIIKRNGKRYLATFLIIKIIDGKPVLMDSGLEETKDGNLGFLNEIGQ